MNIDNVKKSPLNKNEKSRRAFFLACLVFLVILVIIPQTGCSDKGPVSKMDFCLNTSCEIKIYDMSSGKAEKILDDAFDEMREYENILSKTVEGSDVYKINHADGAPVEVSQDTINVINIGLEMAELSGGMFDITVGKLTDLWNFTGDDPSVPQDSEIKALLPGIDYRSVNVDGSEVSLKGGAAQLDLGGVAKGYIADRIGEFLEDQGVERAIVNLGGNVVAIGSKDDDSKWTIGIERPYSDRTEVVGTIEAEDTTVVTSGIYERNFEENGVLYHHVLDPNTGYPAESDLEAVTITAAKGNSGFCDGLSTVCLMLGKDKAQSLIAELQEKYPKMGLEAVFIDKNDIMVQTEGMNVSPVN